MIINEPFNQFYIYNNSGLSNRLRFNSLLILCKEIPLDVSLKVSVASLGSIIAS